MSHFRLRQIINPLGARAAAAFEAALRRIPAVQRRLEAQYAALLADIEPSLKPYRHEFPAYTRLPRSDATAMISLP